IIPCTSRRLLREQPGLSASAESLASKREGHSAPTVWLLVQVMFLTNGYELFKIQWGGMNPLHLFREKTAKT
ncbi:MAG: hypothetical protein II038_05465, partial [Lachnospiraceae bacterium]|nr:hypothetical protein [Lachnospiraceae bacterium]